MVTISFQAEAEFRIPVGTRWGTHNGNDCECPSPVMLADGSTFDIRNSCKQRGRVLKMVESTDFGVTPQAGPLYFLLLCGLTSHFLGGILGSTEVFNFN